MAKVLGMISNNVVYGVSTGKDSNIAKDLLREVQKAKREDNKFNKIRTKMICQGLNVDERKLKKMEELYQKFKDQEGLSEADNVDNAIKSANAAKNAKRKETISFLTMIASFGGQVAGAISPELVEMAAVALASVTSVIPAVGLTLGAAAATLLVGSYKYFKSKKAGEADISSKTEEERKKVIAFVNKVIALSNAITARKAEVMDMQKKLTKKEFNVAIKRMVQEMVSSYGLSGQVEASVNDGLVEQAENEAGESKEETGEKLKDVTTDKAEKEKQEEIAEMEAKQKELQANEEAEVNGITNI